MTSTDQWEQFPATLADSSAAGEWVRAGHNQVMSRQGLGVAIVGLLTLSLAAQSPPAFEVASIKVGPPPTATPGGGVTLMVGAGPRPGGRWVAQNATLAILLQAAYGGFSLPGQIVGAPAWAGATRFDINAIAAGDPPRTQMSEMVRRLLAERFKLKVRAETREVDVYALVLARRDGTLGPGLRPSAIDCEALEAARARGEALSASPSSPDAPPPCSMSSRFVPPSAQRHIATAMPISAVVETAQYVTGRPVIDRTGLTGRFDIDYEYARRLPGASDVIDTPGGAASIFTALQERLGLRLESGKGRMDVLIIEHVEMPTPD
jgi:uncharacterized protein (TIGR03435 family)